MEIKKVFSVVFLLVLTLQGCSYKTTYQPIEYSSMVNDKPRIVEQSNKYIGVFDKGDRIIDPTPLNITEDKVNFTHTDRKFFTVVHKEDTLVVSNREIDFRKVHNFRDLGGIPTSEGRYTKWGKIYRSGHLHKLNSKEKEKVVSLGITTIIDLRTDKEIGKKPDKTPNSLTYHNYQAYDDSEDMFSKTKKDVLKGKLTPSQADSLVVEFYSLYPTHDIKKVREIVLTILDNTESTLFHCSAGKDRTGMIGAILLSILKVEQQVIIDEYLLSNNYRVEEVSSRMKLAKFGKFLYPKINYQVIENFSWIKPMYIQAMFDGIAKEYGSMENYILNGLQIDKEKQREYIEKYTQ
ncbi:tyrosine-protein phosphatase [Myroides albus]|uniref:Protein-tyrosine-phosphatase n=1 Tax=Myroides albus TaxID=2562892 RepID=A0A6I3LRM9_9FLAO|nr:tyrosine-protein phosphatase [Myroides albus]MTG98762.1 protein-tyrosine-phosphatase [Myroides albus]UVD79921.1 tyrosine-protein phosphatase [Myroides albus]